MVLTGYSGARGTLIYEKNLKAKSSCQTPFKLLKKEVGSGVGSDPFVRDADPELDPHQNVTDPQRCFLHLNSSLTDLTKCVGICWY